MRNVQNQKLTWSWQVNSNLMNICHTIDLEKYDQTKSSSTSCVIFMPTTSAHRVVTWRKICMRVVLKLNLIFPTAIAVPLVQCKYYTSPKLLVSIPVKLLYCHSSSTLSIWSNCCIILLLLFVCEHKILNICLCSVRPIQHKCFT